MIIFTAAVIIIEVFIIYIVFIFITVIVVDFRRLSLPIIDIFIIIVGCFVLKKFLGA